MEVIEPQAEGAGVIAEAAPPESAPGDDPATASRLDVIEQRLAALESVLASDTGQRLLDIKGGFAAAGGLIDGLQRFIEDDLLAQVRERLQKTDQALAAAQQLIQAQQLKLQMREHMIESLQRQLEEARHAS